MIAMRYCLVILICFLAFGANAQHYVKRKYIRNVIPLDVRRFFRQEFHEAKNLRWEIYSDHVVPFIATFSMDGIEHKAMFDDEKHFVHIQPVSIVSPAFILDTLKARFGSVEIIPLDISKESYCTYTKKGRHYSIAETRTEFSYRYRVPCNGTYYFARYYRNQLGYFVAKKLAEPPVPGPDNCISD